MHRDFHEIDIRCLLSAFLLCRFNCFTLINQHCSTYLYLPTWLNLAHLRTWWTHVFMLIRVHCPFLNEKNIYSRNKIDLTVFSCWLIHIWLTTKYIGRIGWCTWDWLKLNHSACVHYYNGWAVFLINLFKIRIWNTKLDLAFNRVDENRYIYIVSKYFSVLYFVA